MVIYCYMLHLFKIALILLVANVHSDGGVNVMKGIWNSVLKGTYSLENIISPIIYNPIDIYSALEIYGFAFIYFGPVLLPC